MTEEKEIYRQRNYVSIKTLMPEKTKLCFLTLPIELIYRILDNLDELTILLSMRNVCRRLDAITDTYHRYQVMLSDLFFFFKTKFHCIRDERERTRLYITENNIFRFLPFSKYMIEFFE